MRYGRRERAQRRETLGDDQFAMRLFERAGALFDAALEHGVERLDFVMRGLEALAFLAQREAAFAEHHKGATEDPDLVAAIGLADLDRQIAAAEPAHPIGDLRERLQDEARRDPMSDQQREKETAQREGGEQREGA